MILGAIERTLAARGVARRGDARVLVACSGGLDSVVLAEATCRLLGGRRVILAHVDHGVRAGSSDDARFVADLAVGLGADARLRGVTTSPDEAAMRAARYAALEAAVAETGAAVGLLAHHQGDQAETVLLRLIRSPGPAALYGMPAARGVFARPLLGVPRAELERYARRHHLGFREDPTNGWPGYLRNRVRRELLPLLEARYRPGIARRLASIPLPNAIRLERAPVAAAGEEGPERAIFDAAVFPSLAVGALDAERLGELGPDAVELDRAGLALFAGPRIAWIPGVFRVADGRSGPSTTEVWVASIDAGS